MTMEAAPTAAPRAWFTAEPDPSARLRLFCFHHAGGGASFFTDWPVHIGRSASVVAVQLPGREGRAREPRVSDMTTLLDRLEELLEPWLDVPHVFYGHSMGAFVAHALTRRRLAGGRPLPRRLLIGAAKAPHLPIVLAQAEEMPDDELGQLLVGMGGMSAVMLRYPDWLNAATQLVRDDLRICATNPYRDIVPVPVPVDLFAGESDPVVSVEDITAWDQHTSEHAKLHVLRGGHFFTRDSEETFLPLLTRILDDCHAPAPRLP
jgi:surfactin synthase thioesterase subunit